MRKLNILLLAVAATFVFAHPAAMAATQGEEKTIPVRKAKVYTDTMPYICEDNEKPCKRDNPHLLTLTVGDGKTCITKPTIKLGKVKKGHVNVTVTVLVAPSKKGCVKKMTVTRPLPYAPTHVSDKTSGKKMTVSQFTTS